MSGEDSNAVEQLASLIDAEANGARQEPQVSLFRKKPQPPARPEPFSAVRNRIFPHPQKVARDPNSMEDGPNLRLIREIQERCDRLSESSRQMERTAHRLVKEAASHVSQRTSLTDRCKQAVAEVRGAYVLLSDQIVAISRQHEHVAELQRFRIDLKGDAERLEAVTQNAQRKASDATMRIAALTEECNGLRNQLTTSKSDVDVAEKQIVELQRRMEAAIELKQRDIEAFRSLQVSDRALLQQEISALQEQNETCCNRLSDALRSQHEAVSVVRRLVDCFRVDYANRLPPDTGNDPLQLYAAVEDVRQSDLLALRRQLRDVERSYEEVKNTGPPTQLQHALDAEQQTNTRLLDELALATSELKKLKESQSQAIENDKAASELLAATNEIATLRADLRQKSSDVAECIRIKNSEIEALKRTHCQAIAELRQQLQTNDRQRKHKGANNSVSSASLLGYAHRSSQTSAKRKTLLTEESDASFV